MQGVKPTFIEELSSPFLHESSGLWQLANIYLSHLNTVIAARFLDDNATDQCIRYTTHVPNLTVCRRMNQHSVTTTIIDHCLILSGHICQADPSCKHIRDLQTSIHQLLEDKRQPCSCTPQSWVRTRAPQHTECIVLWQCYTKCRLFTGVTYGNYGRQDFRLGNPHKRIQLLYPLHRDKNTQE